MTRPVAGISLDVDNEWSYLKTRGRPEWEGLPSYLDVLLPTALDALDEAGMKITFFIVGLDAAQEKNADPLALLVDRGHEVGNHSFRHEPWLHRYTPDEIRSELEEAEAHIERACGQRPKGFRGPGFSLSGETLRVLSDRGYLYDASTLPTWIGPLARMYYFRAAQLDDEQAEERDQLFGTWRDALRPVSPYLWRLDRGDQLLELPVTTIPGVRTPFHLSYLLYLARYSRRLMRAYLEVALEACRISRTPVSFLLHPLDLLGGDQVESLAFFPGMDLDGATKRRLFVEVLQAIAERFDAVPMSELARRVLGRHDLPIRDVAGDLA